jgi:hypothetical protein
MEEVFCDHVVPLVVDSLLQRSLQHMDISLSIAEFWPTFQVNRNSWNTSEAFEYSADSVARWVCLNRGGVQTLYESQMDAQYWHASHDRAVLCSYKHFEWRNGFLRDIHVLSRVNKAWYKTVAGAVPAASSDIHPAWNRRDNWTWQLPNPPLLSWPLRVELFQHSRPLVYRMARIPWLQGDELSLFHQVMHSRFAYHPCGYVALTLNFPCRHFVRDPELSTGDVWETQPMWIMVETETRRHRDAVQAWWSWTEAIGEIVPNQRLRPPLFHRRVFA